MLVRRVIELKRDEHYRVTCTSKEISLTLDMWVTIKKYSSGWFSLVGTVYGVCVMLFYHLTRTLPARFPLCGPVVRVSPPIRHPWVNAQVCREIKIPCKRFLNLVLDHTKLIYFLHQCLLHWNPLPELSLSPSKPWHTFFNGCGIVDSSSLYDIASSPDCLCRGQGKPILCSL